MENLEERLACVGIATAIACCTHRDQTDKSGAPYMTHVMRVFHRAMRQHGVPAGIVAMLHDTVEDGGPSVEALRAWGFPAVLVDAVDAISRRPEEQYIDYLARVRSIPLALAVKRIDLADNLDPGRLAQLPAATAERLRGKYQNALDALEREEKGA